MIEAQNLKRNYPRSTPIRRISHKTSNNQNLYQNKRFPNLGCYTLCHVVFGNLYLIQSVLFLVVFICGTDSEQIQLILLLLWCYCFCYGAILHRNLVVPLIGYFGRILGYPFWSHLWVARALLDQIQFSQVPSPNKNQRSTRNNGCWLRNQKADVIEYDFQHLYDFKFSSEWITILYTTIFKRLAILSISIS